MVYDLNKIVSEIKDKKYWYFGNHSKDFVKMCYSVQLISQLDEHTTQEEYERVRKKFNANNPGINLEAAMFKSNISAKVYGLLDPTQRDYAKSDLTPVFNEIKKRTQGDFKKTNLYEDLIEQQIEKMFCITPLFKIAGKEDFQLYPLFLLYKVLLQLGLETGQYSISNVEFNYFVATARTYSEWRNVVDTVLYYREMDHIEDLLVLKMKEVKASPPDQRYYQFLKYIKTITMIPSEGKPQTIILKDVGKVRDKINTFELINSFKPNSPGSLPNGLLNYRDYVQFLGKNIPLLPRL
ncbi:hypothetical protein PH210_06230 [Paenibacillus sp. BSR1-1]|uniref:hypothetical protein n=1 Tax=Paenibacillus sp. BSR1-1 TaxID=3020845 RepID=UPI0025AECFCC|nr:hypothetical protein [Paenibacillus sp. BSR1-1]MDN3015803.1 hypothetical protein [Paenibacillus sp. BSR1-1]